MISPQSQSTPILELNVPIKSDDECVLSAMSKVIKVIFPRLIQTRLEDVEKQTAVIKKPILYRYGPGEKALLDVNCRVITGF